MLDKSCRKHKDNVLCCEKKEEKMKIRLTKTKEKAFLRNKCVVNKVRK